MPHARPAHSRIDFEMDRNDAAGRAPDLFEANDLLTRRHGCRPVAIGQGSVLGWKQRAQDQNWPARPELTQCGRLGDVGHGKQIRPGMHEPRRDMMHSVTIRVRLDHRDVAHVQWQRRADEAQVSFEGREINLGPAAERTTHREDGAR